MENPRVLILMGSDSDYPTVRGASEFLSSMGVAHDVRVTSAHRSPERTERIIAEAEAAGVRVFIAAAGMAAHLAGVVAAKTILPVIGIPIEASHMGGLDALLSTVQMPPGIPVATVAVGKAGATNAAVLACQILALSDSGLEEKLRQNKLDMAKQVEERDERLTEARNS